MSIKANAIQEARDAGFEVVMGTPSTLLLDIDDGLTFNRELFMVLEENLPGIEITGEWTSKDGKGKHMVIELPFAINADQRLCLQACLGSDPKRELLGVLYRILPSCLFKPGPKDDDGWGSY
jgi:hypothetical protein